MNQLFCDVPTGVGAAGALTVNIDELRHVVERGARWAVERGYGQ
jgi:RNA-splicing ligase RtcB